MAKKQHKIFLSKSQRETLEKLTNTGKTSARKLNRARILLLSDEAKGNASKTDKEISEILGISLQTSFRIRKNFVKEGMEASLEEKPRPGQPKKLDGKQEAKLTALACSTPPDGRNKWTLRLLADKMVELEIVDSIVPNTVRSTLKKTNLSLT